MNYIIMADGKETRWKNPTGTPKHLIKINGEVLLYRIVRLIKKYDDKASVFITSHNPKYEVEGAVRYEPQNNLLEIDRFTHELITDNCCFLYGDTYYEEEDLELIVKDNDYNPMMFYGNQKSIVAVKVKDGKLFKHHVARVRKLYQLGKIEKCIGWQVYASYTDGDFALKQILTDFKLLKTETHDFNTYEEYLRAISREMIIKKQFIATL